LTKNQSPRAEILDGASCRGRRSARRLCIAGLAVLLLLLTAIGSLFYSRPLRIAKITTYITGPLKPGGREVDYFAAIAKTIRSESMASDENGYRLILQHLGKSSDMAPAQFATICEQLGLAPDEIHPDMALEEPFDFMMAYVASEEFDRMLLEDLAPEHRSTDRLKDVLYYRLNEGPWTLDALPMMAQWLEANSPALDLVGRAVRKPAFHAPLVRHHESEFIVLDRAHPELQRFRSFARGLHARSNYRIATGDIDGAIDDIITSKRLGRHMAHGGYLIDLLVGRAIEGIAGSIGIASLDHPPAKEQLQRLFEEVNNLPSEPDLEHKLLFERLLVLDVIQTLSTLSLGKRMPAELAMGTRNTAPPRYLDFLGKDWNVVAARFNEHYETHLAGQPLPWTFHCRCAFCNPHLREWSEPCIHNSVSPRQVASHVSIRARSEYLADVLARRFLPHVGGADEAMRLTRCGEQMKLITLAMLIYERDHGTLPPAWSVDSDGNPLHSWRVLLLPYLGHQALYDSIRLDEAWDSEYNRQFHAEAVPFYRCPSDPVAEPGQTTYSVVVGPEMPFQAGRGKALADFGPHSNDMILLVERTKPVCWMDPSQEVPRLDLDESISARQRHQFGRTLPSSNGIASTHGGGGRFALRNGAVLFLSDSIEVEQLAKMLKGTYEQPRHPAELLPGG
jgi:hypothetical protein